MDRQLPLNELLKGLKKTNSSNPPLHLLLLSNLTTKGILENYCKYYVDQLGYCSTFINEPIVNLGDIEFLQKGMTLHVDYIVVLLNLEVLYRDSLLTRESFPTQVDVIKPFLSHMCNAIKEKSQATVIWASFEIPPYSLGGIADIQGSSTLQGMIQDLNRFVQTELCQDHRVIYYDMNHSLARLGIDQFYDKRLFYSQNLPYSIQGCSEIARCLQQIIRTCSGKSRKCIILDCDNVLWGNVVGEVGIQNISLGHDPLGIQYVKFQHVLSYLQSKGILLAICSKNNAEDVWEVFTSHPDMVLKKEQIAAFRIDWKDKAQNILSLSKEMNLGLESFVFIDDSKYEVNLVKKALPEVTVLQLNTQILGYPESICTLGGLDSLLQTKEDRIRSELYLHNKKRMDLKNRAVDLKDYIRSLELKMCAYFPEKAQIARLSQLTMRTNQFNFTLTRYSEDQIAQILKDPSKKILAFDASDQFGNYGLIGVAILNFTNASCKIDTFLLSCRALGRFIEEAMLEFCFYCAQEKKALHLYGYYRPTEKNQQTKQFFINHQFHRVKSATELECYVAEVRPMQTQKFELYHTVTNKLTGIGGQPNG